MAQSRWTRSGGAGFRNGLVMLLAAALLGAFSIPSFADDPAAPAPVPAPDAAAVAAQVKNWGKGKIVKMTLVNGEHLTGHIRSVGEDSFTVKVSHTERTIPYSQVTFIKDPPGPITWILIGAAIVIITILIIHH